MSAEPRIKPHVQGNALRKLGADLRWLMEQSGLDPELPTFVLVVDRPKDRDAMIEAFRKNFEPAVMKRPSEPHAIVVHGVRMMVSVRTENA